MGFVHAAVNPAGAKLPQGFPEVFTAGDGNGRRQNLLADSVRRQEGKRKVMAPDGGAVACRQFILEGKSLNAIPLFLLSLAKVYHIFLCLSRVFSKIRLYKIAQKTMTKDINFLISQRGALRLGG